MFEFRFGVDDLAATWFGYSPLQETVLSLRARRFPARYPEHRAWTAGWQPRYETLDTALLDSLIAPVGFVPDFLTPRPGSPRPDFAAELAVLAATPPEVVRADVLAAYRGDGSPLPPVLAGLIDDPAALSARAAEALEAYWTRCLAPVWWPRARSVLEADITHRGRMLSERGAEGLFADLDARLSWHAGVLRLVDPHPAVRAVGTAVDVAGRGLVLIPTLFGLGAQTDITQLGPPLITYPARGRATMAEGLTAGRGRPGGAMPGEGPVRAPGEPPAALVGLIGAPRARLLTLLETPASTTELAHRLGVTPGAVSRHLGALASAGLLERTRHGRSVLYRRSLLGDGLAGGGTTR
ncbi:winged helix-turn-helix domain-containing protein [Kitasatospora sp. CM 4170]|uniref:ArsR/SmtB family transcription factor n=1 Tax=Kitasatospora aburaviensis TaxID=67265 RepID=A0ABW1EQ15_9ACTN|nr:winged helix-turn-helix domain-containing protein [Kitasatospora sp. CM 4170]WNM48630.1 winged helix-turn-helix domain-containing protein [Kitasatospora sp. CM 4170]